MGVGSGFVNVWAKIRNKSSFERYDSTVGNHGFFALAFLIIHFFFPFFFLFLPFFFFPLVSVPLAAMSAYFVFCHLHLTRSSLLFLHACELFAYPSFVLIIYYYYYYYCYYVPYTCASNYIYCVVGKSNGCSPFQEIANDAEVRVSDVGGAMTSLCRISPPIT